ncbi:MAG: decarboxylating 6-phosphogluconate dehydrogenase [Deltaproteobacteria bacterium]|nr:decarboxylating 6-phosphogluconate dehydrogenase [Deltaproteobacteria bacterium]
MRIGMVGLGKMGRNMALRLIRGGHEIVAFDRSAEAVREASREGAIPAATLAETAAKLSPPRIVWLMVPAGNPVDECVDILAALLSKGDVVVDGGNSLYKDAPGRAERLGNRGIRFLDSGTSGGIWGLSEGYCLMVGGDRDAFDLLSPVFTTLAPPGGFAYMGPHGAGHFVKMVHNGIEYGMMQAYGEGFELLSTAPFPLDLPSIAALWSHGSVVRSWLLELAAAALERNPDLSGISPYVEDSGEGRWTVERSIEAGVPLPAISLSLYMRFLSRQENSFAMRMMAALRNEFGGHGVKASVPEREKG